MTGPDRTEMLIETLRGQVHILTQQNEQLEKQIISSNNLICLMVQKFGNPVILTEKEVREAPMQGALCVSTDTETNSILITFEEETTEDSEPNATQNPQGE